MYELGKKDEIFGSNLLEPVGSGPLRQWPSLKSGFSLVCGYNQGLGERMIVCEGMADVQQLNDGYSSGWALDINWYQGPDPGFIIAITPP